MNINVADISNLNTPHKRRAAQQERDRGAKELSLSQSLDKGRRRRGGHQSKALEFALGLQFNARGGAKSNEDLFISVKGEAPVAPQRRNGLLDSPTPAVKRKTEKVNTRAKAAPMTGRKGKGRNGKGKAKAKVGPTSKNGQSGGKGSGKSKRSALEKA